MIKLTRDGWWKELGDLNLPGPFVGTLRSMIHTRWCLEQFMRRVNPAHVTEQDIRWAKQYLADGIEFGGKHYTILTITPKDTANYGTTFSMIGTLPDSKVEQI